MCTVSCYCNPIKCSVKTVQTQQDIRRKCEGLTISTLIELLIQTVLHPKPQEYLLTALEVGDASGSLTLFSCFGTSHECFLPHLDAYNSLPIHAVPLTNRSCWDQHVGSIKIPEENPTGKHGVLFPEDYPDKYPEFIKSLNNDLASV